MQIAGDDKENKPDPPSRLVVWDTTIEKLGELLARTTEGSWSNATNSVAGSAAWKSIAAAVAPAQAPIEHSG